MAWTLGFPTKIGLSRQVHPRAWCRAPGRRQPQEKQGPAKKLPFGCPFVRASLRPFVESRLRHVLVPNVTTWSVDILLKLPPKSMATSSSKIGPLRGRPFVKMSSTESKLKMYAADHSTFSAINKGTFLPVPCASKHLGEVFSGYGARSGPRDDQAANGMPPFKAMIIQTYHPNIAAVIKLMHTAVLFPSEKNHSFDKQEAPYQWTQLPRLHMRENVPASLSPWQALGRELTTAQRRMLS